MQHNCIKAFYNYSIQLQTAPDRTSRLQDLEAPSSKTFSFASNETKLHTCSHRLRKKIIVFSFSTKKNNYKKIDTALKSGENL